MIAAIDTTTEIASLAIVKEGVVLAEMTWRTGQNHTIQLLPNLQHLLKLTGTVITSLTGIVVAKGPGSFNGLRVGISTAKGLAYALEIPIVGINSLEVTAYGHADTATQICPLYNAGRNEIATAMYQKRVGCWCELKEAHIATVESLCAEISEPTLFCGEYAGQISSRLSALLGDKAVFASPSTDLRRAAYLAELGRKRLESGQTDLVTTLQPLYLRRPPITVAKHK
jgi:tRNA threonylcarbamoyl adenosine modification protein YeaZ